MSITLWRFFAYLAASCAAIIGARAGLVWVSLFCFILGSALHMYFFDKAVQKAREEPSPR